MFKKQTTPVVSDNESDSSDFENPDFDTYNQNYSLMYSMSRQFFAQCKKSVMKYLNFSKVGVKMNVGAVLGWLKSSENTLDEATQQRIDSFKKRKQLQFQSLLNRIREIVSDLMDFEKNFKAAFNDACKQTGRVGALMTPALPTPVKKFDRTIMSETTKTPEPTVYSVQTSKISDDNEESVERSLRKQLQKIVLPKPQQLKNTDPFPTTQHACLNRLTDKVNNMITYMRSEKEREFKIVEIFTKNKIIVPDIDTSNPIIEQLQVQIDGLKSEVKTLKVEVALKKREYDRLAARLLQEMTREDKIAGEKIYQNEDYAVVMISKSKKKIEPLKLTGLSSKSLLSYIYLLQERLSTLVETKHRLSDGQQHAPHKMPSAINLNMSFTNVYSPIEVKNIIDSTISKKK